jgi:hypothetical protein
MSSNAVRLPIDTQLEAALRFLAAEGLPATPVRLDVERVEWGGTACPQVNQLELTEAGELTLEAPAPSGNAIVDDPSAWNPSVFKAYVPNHGALTIEQGIAHVTRAQFGSDGSSYTARVQAFAWTVGSSASASTKLWAARIKFARPKPTQCLSFPRGNMVLALGHRSSWGYRFDTTNGLAYLIPDEDRDHWVIAIDATTSPAGPGLDHVVRLLATIGFVLGEPLTVDVFRPVADDHIQGGLVHLGIADMRPDQLSSQPPALPFGGEPGWLASYVERTYGFIVQHPDAPLLVALHLYFASTEGFVDSQFLHAWIAAETLASWALDAKLLRDGAQLRIADHAAWMKWVKDHESDIRAHALPGMEQKLVDRVRASENDRPTPVQRVFLGEGIQWTSEMSDAELVRHGVAHEGSIPGYRQRDWKKDLARVGTAKTMLAAIIARLIGYEGPISDRSKSCFSIAVRDEPAWWQPSPLIQQIIYESLPAPTESVPDSK